VTRHYVLVALLVACGTEADAPPAPPPPPTMELVSRKILYSIPAPPDDGMTHEIELEDASGHALDHLGEALLRAARHEGVARLVFYGGSHTASDLYTAEIRTRLQRRFGNAGHGFVLGAMPITDYWQSGAQVEDGEGWDTMVPDFKHFGTDTYGLAGVAFDAHVPAWAAARTDYSTASHLEVLYLAQPGGGTIDVAIDDQPIETIDTASDAPRAGLHTYAVPDGSHRIALETSGDPSVRLFGFVLERETDHGVVVDQLGIAGSKARHQLFWDRDLWRTLLATRHPDLIALSYGNNEGDDQHLATFEHVEHFREMVRRVREDFPRASCLVIGPSDRQVPDAAGVLATPPLILELREAQRTIAAEEGCAFWDTIAWQGGPGAVERWIAADPPLEREDRLHFTERGYRRMGTSLLRSIGRNLRQGAPLP
jgi:lysophospholipase L1-like esterase